LITHFWISANIVEHTLAGIVAKATAISVTVPLVSTAFLFNIGQEFEQTGGVASPFSFDQIVLFRTILGMTSLVATIVCVVVARKCSQPGMHAPLTARTLPGRLHHLLTLFLMTQSRISSLPLFLCLDHQRSCLQTLLRPVTCSPQNPANKRGGQVNGPDDNTATSSIHAAITVLAFSQTHFFAFGGSNSISSINLSNAYNGITNYSMLTVGILLFAANWTGPIWWSSAACSLVPYHAPQSTPPLNNIENKPRTADNASNGGDERLQAQAWPWLSYLSAISALMAAITLIVMILCTVQREHHTVWTLWGSKYLYSVFWVLEWHIVVSLVLSSCLRALRSLG
jgi:ethanolaminephosphotransferase